MYKVLKNSTPKKTYIGKVNKYKDTKDSKMAYAYLKECYDQEGHKHIY